MISKVTFRKEPDQFYSTLKHRVNEYFNQNCISKKANIFFYVKALVLISVYILLYSFLIGSNNARLAFVSMVLLGPFAILIGINVAHDAAHGNISRTKWINSIFLLLFDFLGSNSYMWRKRHVFSHHVFPNILNKDADLKQNPLVRIFPGDKILPAHKYQFIYAPFLYLLYTINWLFFRDFQDFFKSQIGSLEIESHDKIEVLKLLLFKLFYISFIFVIPMSFSVLSSQTIILAFVLMNFSASILITLALIPSHVAENSNFLLPDKNGIMPNSWSHHQVLSVIDFATNNWFLNFFFGGFNHHITHHLFPNINHIHSPKITPIVKQTIKEFELPYNYENSFINAYISHFKLLKNNGIN